MLSQSQLSELLAHVYEAAASPDAWEDVLVTLQEHLDLSAANFGLLEQDDVGRVMEFPASVGFDEDFHRTYESYYKTLDPFPALLRRTRPGHTVTSDKLVPSETLLRSEYYNDFARERDLRHHIAVIVSSSSDVLCMLAGHRGPEQEPFGDQELDLLRFLLPHIQRSVKIHDTLSAASAERDDLGTLVDRLPVGVVLLDEQLRVCRTNSRADQLIAESDALRHKSGLLSAVAASTSREFERAVAKAGPRSEMREGSSLRLPSQNGAELLAHVMPIARERTTWGSDQASVVLLLSDGNERVDRLEGRLSALYDLTPSEASVAARLASGLSLAEVAAERGVTVETARSQLHMVFDKMGVHRQPDLVRRILLGPGLLIDR